MNIISIYKPTFVGRDGWTEYGSCYFKIITPEWQTGKADNRAYVDELLAQTHIVVRRKNGDLDTEKIGYPALVHKKHYGLYVRFKLGADKRWSDFGFERKWQQREAQDFLDREFATIYGFIFL